MLEMCLYIKQTLRTKRHLMKDVQIITKKLNGVRKGAYEQAYRD
jgi:hypothetical protein